MFTSRAERKCCETPSGNTDVGPGSYDAVLAQRRTDFRRETPEYRLQTYLDVALEAVAEVPPVGTYDVRAEPQYIRGHRQAPFGTAGPRFVEQDVGCAPGPTEYFQAQSLPAPLARLERESARKTLVEEHRVPGVERAPAGNPKSRTCQNEITSFCEFPAGS